MFPLHKVSKFGQSAGGHKKRLSKKYSEIKIYEDQDYINQVVQLEEGKTG